MKMNYDEYIYLIEDLYIKTYGIIKTNNKYYKSYINKYNYCIYGDYMIEKLRGRGYISKEEFENNNNTKIEDIELKVKIKKKSII